MTDEKFRRFCELMALIAENIEKEVKSSKIGLLWNFLKDYDIEDLERVGYDMIRESNYHVIPSVGDFIRRIEGDKKDILDSVANEQAQAVIDSISKVGIYGAVRFEDQATTWAINNLGGWVRLCMMRQEDVKFWRRDFISLYKSMNGKAPKTDKVFGQPGSTRIHVVKCSEIGTKPVQLIGEDHGRE